MERAYELKLLEWVYIMSWITSLVLALGGLTSSIAAIAISGIILLVISQLGLLTYRRLFSHKSQQ